MPELDPYRFLPTDRMGEEVEQQPATYARFAMLDGDGKVIPIRPPSIPLDVWARVLDCQGFPTGTLKRKRLRKLHEVYQDLKMALDVRVCGKCKNETPNGHDGWRTTHHAGCGGEYEPLLDEYFCGPRDYTADDRNAEVPYKYRWIACYPVTGANEGHYVHVEFVTQLQGCVKAGEPNVIVTPLALGKTFRGMDHAAEIARRCAVLLGA